MLSTRISLIPSFFLLLFTRADFVVQNTLYIISQAETPSLGVDGLTPVGLKRAQTCIPNVFRDLDISLIISCTPDPESGACLAAVATVMPLANELNLTVDISCGTGENTYEHCVTDLITDFADKSNKSILAVWDANDQGNFLDNLDIDIPNDVDDGVFHHDVITVIRSWTFSSRISQNCSNVDGRASGTGEVFMHQPEF